MYNDCFIVGSFYSNDEIFKTLKVANAGGIRLSINDNRVLRAAVFTSEPGIGISGENPYHDRFEGDVLTYTAAGKFGEQTLSGINKRIIEQTDFNFPIHGFILVANRRNKTIGPKRWKYLGLLEYLRHYQDMQIDSDEKVRKVWIFELKIHNEPSAVSVSSDIEISKKILIESRNKNIAFDGEVVDDRTNENDINIQKIEKIRGKLLAMDPNKFEYFIKNLLASTGFLEVCVTKYSADGGVDVNAKAGPGMWIFESSLVQVQAKRWLHSVGRKEVAELRGSLRPFAKGVVVTTSHFTKAALIEANENGKVPIRLVDGFSLSKTVANANITVN